VAFRFAAAGTCSCPLDRTDETQSFYARIPFYRLPEALRTISELQTPKTTSLHPLDIIRCQRLKLWDVDSQRMVALTEI